MKLHGVVLPVLSLTVPNIRYAFELVGKKAVVTPVLLVPEKVTPAGLETQVIGFTVPMPWLTRDWMLLVAVVDPQV